MKLKTMIMSPAGNRTLFVLSPVPQKMHATVASHLLTLSLNIEQVGFIEKDSMTMAGGEFCGNATRAYALYLAKKKGLMDEQTISVKVSGSKDPLQVLVAPLKDFAKLSMNLPYSISPYSYHKEATGTLVKFQGIHHLVLEDRAPDLEFFHKIKDDLLKKESIDALGIMFLENHKKTMTPIVHVTEINSTFIEGSCASGSVAAACTLAKEGTTSFTFKQPEGEITSTITKKSGEIIYASVEGTIQIEAETDIFLPIS